MDQQTYRADSGTMPEARGQETRLRNLSLAPQLESVAYHTFLSNRVTVLTLEREKGENKPEKGYIIL